MAQSNLPEVLDTVKGLVSYDNGNVFDRSFLFPKRAEKRLDVQKEIMLRMIDTNEQVKLAQIEAEKEIALAQMQYSFELQKMKNETVCQIFQSIGECDTENYDRANNFVCSDLREIGDIISKL